MNYTRRPTRKMTPSGTTYGITMGCAHCQRRMNNFAGGYSRGLNGELLCHPNGPNRPNCYVLVTNYGHDTPCRHKKCYEDHPNKVLDYLAPAKRTRKKVKV